MAPSGAAGGPRDDNPNGHRRGGPKRVARSGAHGSPRAAKQGERKEHKEHAGPDRGRDQVSGRAGPDGRGRDQLAERAGADQHAVYAGPEEHGNLHEDATHLAGAVDALLGSPFLGLGPRDAVGALRFLGSQAAREPRLLLEGAQRTARELVRITLGRSQVAPERADKRFRDPAWSRSPIFRAFMQAYLHLGAELDRFAEGLGLEGHNAERVQFALSLVREAMAPTNALLTNPEALRRAVDTRGESLRRGLVNMINDILNNHGMPSQVDRRPFTVGKNLAVTPGAVIHRTEVFELIQYAPQAEQVYRRPLLCVPPQVNKYYALDLAPGRSMTEYLLQRGHQLFQISWRNPTAEQRDWGFDTYLQAALEAMDVVTEITGSPDLSLFGGCAGGVLVSILLAYLAAKEDTRVATGTLLVTMLDCDIDAQILLFATPQTLALARQASSRTGVLDGWEMAEVFAWLRPNDLVWNYWVNNYLLGRNPPAFDILAWNADTTRLPERLHHQLLDMAAGNLLTHPGALKVLGTPIDLSRITCDTYVAAGLTDHITPWRGCYRSTQLLSGSSRFVLCSSGHVQTVVAAPDHPRLGYFVNPRTPPEPDAWMAGAERHDGSWWEDFAAWLSARSGEKIEAPATVGSKRFPAQEPAPGTYIFQ